MTKTQSAYSRKLDVSKNRSPLRTKKKISNRFTCGVNVSDSSSLKNSKYITTPLNDIEQCAPQLNRIQLNDSDAQAPQSSHAQINLSCANKPSKNANLNQSTASSSLVSKKSCKPSLFGKSVLDEGHSQAEIKPVSPAVSPDTDNPVVFVVHASVGSGHRSAAKSIAQAFEVLKQEGSPEIPSNLEVEVIDILDWGYIKFDGDKTASMFVGATRPVYDLVWRYSFTGRLLWGGGTIWSHAMFAPFTNYIAEKRPLAIIATHITGANAAVAARMITGQNYPVISVPTDYETEGLWPHDDTDLFCVATEAMAETLRARKIENERIQITGIPTREDFRHDYDRVSTREVFNLPQDKQVVLVLAGAYLPRPYLRFRDAIDETIPHFPSFDNLHFVIVAGNDTAYKNHLHELCLHNHVDNVSILGYVNEMAALMAASDLVLCKSGGLTVTECLCAQVPMLLLGRAYGQEKVNVNMLTSKGAAWHITTPRELLGVLRCIAQEPRTVKAMLLNGQSLRRPNAARDIALTSMELAKTGSNRQKPADGKHFVRFYIGEEPAHVR